MVESAQQWAYPRKLYHGRLFEVDGMTHLRSQRLWLAVYLAVAVFTFGHVAAETERRINSPQCATPELRVASRGLTCYGEPGLEAVLPAVLWPFYWSWELQQ